MNSMENKGSIFGIFRFTLNIYKAKLISFTSNYCQRVDSLAARNIFHSSLLQFLFAFTPLPFPPWIMHDASGFSNVFCASSYIISNFMFFFSSMVVCSFRSISRYTDTLPYFLLCFFICVLYGFFTPTITKYVSTFLFIFHHILVALLYILLSIVYHSFHFILILMTCAFFTSFKCICKTLSYLFFTSFYAYAFLLFIILPFY